MLTKRLHLAGHVVWSATEAKQALQILQAESVDVLVTDIVLPEYDGIETIQLARRIHPQSRIVAMSGGSPHALLYLKVAGKLGATQLLEKPFSLAALLTAVAPPQPASPSIG